MADKKQQLVQEILNFLQHEADSDQQKGESLAVAIQIIRELYNVSSIESSTSLLSNFLSSASTTTSAASSSSQTATPKYNVDEDPKFIDFIKIVTEKGYFKNAEPGTPAYAERYQKAKEKFIAKNEEARIAQAEKHKEEGNAFYQQKKYEEAIACYQKAIENNPNKAPYHLNSAVCFYNLQRYEETAAFAKRATELDPTYAKAFKFMGLAYKALAKYQDALDCFNNALKHNTVPSEAVVLEKQVEEVKGKMQGRSMASPGAFPGFPGMPAMPGMGGGMPNLGGLEGILNNPQFMNMVQQVVTQPGFQDMMQNMMQQFGRNGAPGAASGGGLDTSFIENLPEVQNNERLKKIVQEIKTEGFPALMRHQQDPELAALMQKVMGNLGGGGFPGMGGANTEDKGDDSGSSNMYS